MTTTKPTPTKAKAARKATQPTIAKTRKTESISCIIDAAELAAFSLFADHFGFTAETAMESQLLGQLVGLGDSAVSNLAFFDAMEPPAAPVTVKLSFIPEAAELLKTVSRITRRPIDELAGHLLRTAYWTLSGDMEAAQEMGGFDNHHELTSTARDVLESEFEARRGRMMQTNQNLDAWQCLGIERLRPSRLDRLAKTA